jgi:hypothetical protein
VLNQRKHKNFNYQSRYSKEDHSERENEHVSKREISNEWDRTRRTSSDKRKGITLPLLLLLLGIIIAVLYYLETKIG